MTTIDHPFERRMVNGIDILIRAGMNDTQQPLVLLHGIGSRSFSFLPLMAAFDRARTIIAWDAPGYGASSPLAVPMPGVTEYSAALLALLNAEGIQTVDLLGHSLGTLVAAHAAATAPARVNRLALVSPTLGYGAMPGDPLPEAVRARLAELVALGAATFARKRSARLVYHPERSPEVLDAVVAAMTTMVMPGYGQASRLLGSGRILDDVVRLSVPTLVIVGAEDVVTPPDMARKIALSLPHSVRSAPPLVLVEASGHAVCLEAPAQVAALVERHLTET
ncbi:alpha/beta hydrolase [Acidiphilium sp. AL]|uniref:Alpha/beta hydrolase n=1 Tax=Acidiphilium iwatense TaxID=768198 RepID=A0ABS9DZN1_9PROT|nr:MULTISPECIES: alpha/beta hydrolase [Acidiphilium]MCF3948196.1 alpha/beta hydrolase [Acidiphilium iwatense]MCU4161687.1 alpha/beta hydrolase [Acidiphilium sp. AL]